MSEWCVCSASHGQPPGPPQPPRQREQPRQLGRGGGDGRVDEHRGEVVGRDVAVERLERDGRDLLVGQAEALQHDDRRGRVEALEQRELHVRQHERAVALRDQQRSVAGSSAVDREVAPVDHPRAAERVDAEARPGELGERQPGNDHELDVARAARRSCEQRDACAPRPPGCPGTAYTTSPSLAGGSTSASTIPAYTVVEVAAPRRSTSSKDANVRPSASSSATQGWRAVRANRTGAASSDPARRREEEVGSGRPEPDDDDPTGTRPRPIRRSRRVTVWAWPRRAGAARSTCSRLGFHVP